MRPSPVKNYRESFPDVLFPTRRTEGWRTIDLEPVLGTVFAEAPAEAPVFTGPKGIAAHRLSRDDLGEMKEPNAFAAINAHRFQNGLRLLIPDESCLIEPIHIFFPDQNRFREPCAVYPRLVVSAGKRVRASLVLHYAGEGGSERLVSGVNEFYLGTNTHLDVVSLNRDARAFQFILNRFLLGEGSSLESTVFTQGCRIVRHESEVRFRAPKGFASMRGLSVLKGNEQAFHHVTAIHEAPDCTSRQFYKSILAGRAKSEFASMVHVSRDAQKSDSKQLSRSLLLSDTAQGFARPQLLIENDDVSCNHGATVGQIDKDELFYLQSRGISKNDARFLLTLGFAREILDEVRDKGLKAELEKNIREEIKNLAGG